MTFLTFLPVWTIELSYLGDFLAIFWGGSSSDSYSDSLWPWLETETLLFFWARHSFSYLFWSSLAFYSYFCFFSLVSFDQDFLTISFFSFLEQLWNLSSSLYIYQILDENNSNADWAGWISGSFTAFFFETCFLSFSLEESRARAFSAFLVLFFETIFLDFCFEDPDEL